MWCLNHSVILTSYQSEKWIKFSDVGENYLKNFGWRRNVKENDPKYKYCIVGSVLIISNNSFRGLHSIYLDWPRKFLDAISNGTLLQLLASSYSC